MVLDIVVALDMGVGPYMGVDLYYLYMVVVTVMGVMDHAVAQLFLLNMLVIWR